IINLKEPYATNCTDRTLDVFNSDKHSNYTKAACLMKCRNDHTIKACGCSPAKFKAKSSVPICAPNDTILCVYRSQGNLGGTFGLFLGMSCLTILEFLDFVFRKIFYLLRGQRKARTVNAEY
ncbi:hypothetical protein OS493_040074, partial [Desmophyllum pertusum]